MPETVTRIDVLPLPVNQAEIAVCRDALFGRPLHIGLVGQATEAKGITAFLTLAHRFDPSEVVFHLVGRMPAGDDPARYAPLAEPVQDTPLTRPEFTRRLGLLHYVCLPMQSGYYDLSASGAVIDAITWLRPVIATPLPALQEMFGANGDIGYLCRDIEAMHATITAIVRTMDAARYAAQAERLRLLRDSRTPVALSGTVRAMVKNGFPGLLP